MKKSQLIQIIKESLNESTKDSVAQKEFKMNYSQLGAKEKEWVDDEIDNIEYKKKKKVVKEQQEKSVDQLMADLGDAILADNNQAMKIAFKNLKTGLIGRIKNKAEDLKGHLDKKYTEEGIEEAAPSAGMTAKEKSAVVKKAKAGKDIGKKGPGFAKVEKAAEKKYGSKEAGQKVAAAAMWKAQAKK